MELQPCKNYYRLEFWDYGYCYDLYCPYTERAALFAGPRREYAHIGPDNTVYGGLYHHGLPKISFDDFIIKYLGEKYGKCNYSRI